MAGDALHLCCLLGHLLHGVELLFRGHDLGTRKPNGRGDVAQNRRPALRTHDLRVDGICGNLEKFELTSPLGFLLQRHRDAENADFFLARQDAGRIRQHHHVVECREQRIEDVAVDVRRHRLEDLGRIAHKHGKARSSPTGPRSSASAREILRNGRKLIRHVDEALVDAEKLLRVRVRLEEADGRAAATTHGIGLNMPALPRVELLAVFVRREPVIVDHDLRT